MTFTFTTFAVCHATKWSAAGKSVSFFYCKSAKTSFHDVHHHHMGDSQQYSVYNLEDVASNSKWSPSSSTWLFPPLIILLSRLSKIFTFLKISYFELKFPCQHINFDSSVTTIFVHYSRNPIHVIYTHINKNFWSLPRNYCFFWIIHTLRYCKLFWTIPQCPNRNRIELD
jgi:hypothetical protein